jgi:hypothetical protein
MGRLGGFVGILRPVNSVMMGVGILVGVVIAGGFTANIPLEFLVFAFVTGLTLTGSAMVINDYFDRDIDAVNEPDRPIPSGDVKPNEAVAYSLILSLVGLAAAYATSTLNLALAVFSWLVMMIYSAWGKRTGFLGNLMVSTCIGLPFVYGGAIAGNVNPSLLFSALAFLSIAGREDYRGRIRRRHGGEACLRFLRSRHDSLDTPSAPQPRLPLVHPLRSCHRCRPHLRINNATTRPQPRNQQKGQETGSILDALRAPRLRGGNPPIKRR